MDTKYPEGEEKFNDEKTILFGGARRCGKSQLTNILRVGTKRTATTGRTNQPPDSENKHGPSVRQGNQMPVIKIPAPYRLISGEEITKATDESLIQADGILLLSTLFMDCLTLWRNNTGVKYDEGRMTRFGVTGQADTSGVMNPGTRLEVEFKRMGKKQSQKQIDFQAMIERHGGLYLLCDGDFLNQLIIPIRERLARDSKVVR